LDVVQLCSKAVDNRLPSHWLMGTDSKEVMNHMV